MSIRTATMADVPRIVALGEQMHAESARWARIPFNPERAARGMSDLITGGGVVFLYEREGEPVGGIAGALEPHWACDADIAREVAFFIDREHRGGMAASRLICALVTWGRLKGAAWLHAGTSTGLDPEMVAQLYERLGFVRCSIGLEFHYD
ncbi:GNAT family N-acetyltransferase [Cupriavidus campinensis]|jgi:GNAT superfamily N-acetyltransferase|uniref:GNAT family N-acetyltransferase n=1 Tax=Cupriavidus campinensis TaxID=151783 RepID=UPI0024E26618|nr:GNAT family N-acetyltransferase [Cupriavidus campinensis]